MKRYLKLTEPFLLSDPVAGVATGGRYVAYKDLRGVLDSLEPGEELWEIEVARRWKGVRATAMEIPPEDGE